MRVIGFINMPKVLLSISGIIAVAFFLYVSLEQELDERALRAKGEIVQAEVLELRCGGKDYIRFRLDGEEMEKRIYLSTEECDALRSNSQIGLKVDGKNNIVFANDSYNDWSEAESVAILILGFFSILGFIFYGIRPEIKKLRKS